MLTTARGAWQARTNRTVSCFRLSIPQQSGASEAIVEELNQWHQNSSNSVWCACKPHSTSPFTAFKCQSEDRPLPSSVSRARRILRQRPKTGGFSTRLMSARRLLGTRVGRCGRRILVKDLCTRRGDDGHAQSKSTFEKWSPACQTALVIVLTARRDAVPRTRHSD
jgi:hypothetical protein